MPVQAIDEIAVDVGEVVRVRCAAAIDDDYETEFLLWLEEHRAVEAIG